MRKIRLPLEIYGEKNRPCSITICSSNRANVFKNTGIINEIITLVKDLSQRFGIVIFAFCFMPDHLHLVIASESGYSLVDWIRLFKGNATKIIRKHGFQGSIFQPSFYDHFIRKDEDLLKHIRYVLENPIRKQLGNSRRKYPYIGSFGYDLSEIAGG